MNAHFCPALVISIGFLTNLAPSPVAAHRDQYDVVLQHGTLVDGSGQPGRLADVGIVNGRIAAVGYNRLLGAR